MNMNTPIPVDGINPYVTVDEDGAIYMAHVSNESSRRRGTNLVFTAFRYDEDAGLSFVTNQVIASGPVTAPDYHYVSMPCIGLGVNGEVIVAYLAGGDGNRMNNVRIIVRDRFGIWQPSVTVASGDANTPGNLFPGAGANDYSGRMYGGIAQTDGEIGGFDMAVVQEGEINYVYLYYGEYESSPPTSGANAKNGVVHKLKVYDPPPPKGTRVLFR